MSIKIRIEPVKSKQIFNEFIKKYRFEFAGMSVSDKGKKYTLHLMCISDEPLTETVTTALGNVDLDYILYSGKAYGKFCVAVAVKY